MSEVLTIAFQVVLVTYVTAATAYMVWEVSR